MAVQNKDIKSFSDLIITDIPYAEFEPVNIPSKWRKASKKEAKLHRDCLRKGDNGFMPFKDDTGQWWIPE